MRQKRRLLLFLTLLVFLGALWSVLFLTAATHHTVDEQVREVGSQLKCPVCQGESVADSPSVLAQQMRETIRRQLQEGKSEAEIVQYFRASYGEQIIWSPPREGFTLFVWLVPGMLILLGLVLVWITVREWRTAVPQVTTVTASAKVSEKKREQDKGERTELDRYRDLLEQELAADDLLFKSYRREVL